MMTLVFAWYVFLMADCICYSVAIHRHGSMRRRYGLKIVMIPGSGFWCLWKHRTANATVQRRETAEEET